MESTNIHKSYTVSFGWPTLITAAYITSKAIEYLVKKKG